MTEHDEDSVIRNLDRRAERFEVLTREDELDLIIKAKAGDKVALAKLYDHNIRLIKKLARKYMNRGLDMEDLVQEASLGLLHAIDLFDPSKGFKLSTYATWWIRQYAQRGVSNKSRTIRIPIHKQNEIILVQKTFHHFIEKEGKHPTSTELAKETGLDVKVVEKLRLYKQEMASLSESVSDDEDGLTRLDLELAPATSEPEQLIENMLDKSKVREWLAMLDQEDRNIAMYYFGFFDEGDKSESDVARFFQIPLSMAKRRLREIKGKLRKIINYREINTEFLAGVVLTDLGPLEARERLLYALRHELGLSFKESLLVFKEALPVDIARLMRSTFPDKYKKKADGKFQIVPGVVKLGVGNALKDELSSHGIKMELIKS